MEQEANSLFHDMGGRKEENLIIHPDSYRIGISSRSRSGDRILPMSRLSAGERETVSLSVLGALNTMTASMLMMDSPFMHMDDRKADLVLRSLCGKRQTYISLPDGRLSELVRNIKGIGPLTHYRLKRTDEGSTMEVLQ